MSGENETGYSYERIKLMADYLKERTRVVPTVGVICGSGLGGLADLLQEPESFNYSDIPDFPVSTVAGHKGRLVFGKIGDVSVVCMQGRFHAYEGYPLWKCAMPVRVMKLLGVHTLIVTNAAGGLNADFSIGDIMLIKDHINWPAFSGNNPLKGENDERWGPRFLGLNNPYDAKLRNLARKVASDLGLNDILREGVYTMYGGPSYETVSELRLLRAVGGDAVGMSTAHEVILAKHCGMRIFGLSLITNKCVMEYDVERPANHAEVLAAAEKRKKDLENLVTKFIAQLANV